MSIIERVLEKSREERQRAGPGTDAVRTPRGGVVGSAVKSRVDTALRAIALSITADEDACRERRILLDEGQVADQPALAAYRHLSSTLQAVARRQGWVTIGVTSENPRVGGTLTAVNLALTISRERSREVVLLDWNFANPGVCRALGVDPSFELGDFLVGGGHLRELFFSVGEPSLLIAGNAAPTTGLVVADVKPRLDELLRFLRRGTIDPLVLVDLPAMHSTEDATELAAMMDAVLLVAAQDRAAPSDIAKFVDRLGAIPVAGVVLNEAADSE